jgi:hypothetical protein
MAKQVEVKVGNTTTYIPINDGENVEIEINDSDNNVKENISEKKVLKG